MHSSSPHSCYILCPPHPHWLYHSNYTWRRVQVMKLLIMQFYNSKYKELQLLKQHLLRRKPSSGMWRHVEIVLTDISEERITSIFSSVAPAKLVRSRISSCLLPRRWRRYVPTKRRLRQFLHGATSQKTAFFIVTARKTSNLTYNIYCIFVIKKHGLSVWRALYCQLSWQLPGKEPCYTEGNLL
jgi:hypothetical protein